MTLTLPDNLVAKTGLTEAQLRVELACRLYDAQLLSLWEATQLAGYETQSEFWSALIERGIPAFRPTVEDYEEDLRNLGLSSNSDK